MNKIAAIILSSAAMCSCATTYKPPSEPDQSLTISHNKSKSNILAKATDELLLAGYQIQAENAEKGHISTNPMFVRLTPKEANCGTTMGIDYLKDNRTTTEVAYNILIKDNSITIKTNIQGEYRPGASDQDITLTCISKGILEKSLADKIL